MKTDFNPLDGSYNYLQDLCYRTPIIKIKSYINKNYESDVYIKIMDVYMSEPYLDIDFYNSAIGAVPVNDTNTYGFENVYVTYSIKDKGNRVIKVKDCISGNITADNCFKFKIKDSILSVYACIPNTSNALQKDINKVTDSLKFKIRSLENNIYENKIIVYDFNVTYNNRLSGVNIEDYLAFEEDEDWIETENFFMQYNTLTFDTDYSENNLSSFRNSVTAKLYLKFYNKTSRFLAYILHWQNGSNFIVRTYDIPSGSTAKTLKIMGNTDERPSANVVGFMFFDRTLRKYIHSDNNRWYDGNGEPADAKTSGTFANKPLSSDGISVGFAYFCTDKQTTEGETNGIVIYHKGNNVWVDALGRIVE